MEAPLSRYFSDASICWVSVDFLFLGDLRNWGGAVEIFSGCRCGDECLVRYFGLNLGLLLGGGYPTEGGVDRVTV